jgi:glycosyltransferase involved in cell wall biosynthesis
VEATQRLPERPYSQHLLPCWFHKGKFMYLEYNLRLFFYLLCRKRPDVIVAIDLDTIVPVYLVSRLRSAGRVYDAHEWFSEMKEVLRRPAIQSVWKWVERNFVPRFPYGYTVSRSIAESFEKLYRVRYPVIMNATVLTELPQHFEKTDQPYLLYQGAVNEGRCLEYLIPAMRHVEMSLRIYGDGNYMEECRKLILEHSVEQKVLLMGKLDPEALQEVTARAFAGINLVEPQGANQLLSLANKFFDYIHAGIPQLTMNFPEYRRINDTFEVALLIDQPDPVLITESLNNLILNPVLYRRLAANCEKARNQYNWQEEEKKLTAFYHSYFKSR